MSLTEVPPPKHGGTFFYCPWTEFNAATAAVNWCARSWRGSRFRTAKAARRHFRRHHA